MAAATFAGPTLWLRGQSTPSKRLNIAVIGAFGKGQSDTRGVEKDHNIVALVDVDGSRLDSAAQAHLKNVQKSNPAAPSPRLYADFRKMFDDMAKDIDAVIVSTPDHTHFVAAMWALRHKKHMASGRLKKTEPRSSHPNNPQLEWASCIVNGGRCSSGFDYSAPLSEFVQLGNLAIRSGQTIQWDAANMKVTNVTAANRLIKRPVYREGWR